MYSILENSEKMYQEYVEKKSFYLEIFQKIIYIYIFLLLFYIRDMCSPFITSTKLTQNILPLSDKIWISYSLIVQKTIPDFAKNHSWAACAQTLLIIIAPVSKFIIYVKNTKGEIRFAERKKYIKKREDIIHKRWKKVRRSHISLPTFNFVI